MSVIECTREVKPSRFDISREFQSLRKNFRTPRINDVVCYIININNELAQKIGKDFSADLDISSLVENKTL